MSKIDKLYVCQFCDKSYSNKSSLTRHQKNNEKCMEIQYKLKKQVTCRYCEKVFTRKDTVVKHYLTCKVKKDFDCLYELIENTKVNLIINNFKCKHCGNLFYSQHSLEEHQKCAGYCLDYRKGLNKKYKCGYCQSIVSSIYSLNRHEKTCSRKKEVKKIKDVLEDICYRKKVSKIKDYEQTLDDLAKNKIQDYFS